MGNLVGITGTPGTGKKTIAPLVASRLGLPCHGLNDLAVLYGFVSLEGTVQEIDTAALAKKISRELSGPALVYGHLLPYVLEKRAVSKVIVLRCKPSVIKRRLLARRYAFDKVLENVEAELIGLISSDARSAFGERKTAEFDTSDTSAGFAASSITEIFREPGRFRPLMDWTLDYDSASKLKSLLSERKTAPALS